MRARAGTSVSVEDAARRPGRDRRAPEAARRKIKRVTVGNVGDKAVARRSANGPVVGRCASSLDARASAFRTSLVQERYWVNRSQSADIGCCAITHNM